MDELALSVGINARSIDGGVIWFREQSKNEIILKKNECLIEPIQSKRKRSGQRTVIPVLSRERQARLGEWISSFYSRRTKGLGHGPRIAKWLESMVAVNFYVHPDDWKLVDANTIKLLQDSPGIVTETVKRKAVNKQVKPENALQSRDGILEGALTVGVQEVINLYSILPQLGTTNFRLIIFMLSQVWLDPIIRPEIKEVAQFMTRVKVGTSGFQIDYTHPYVKAMYLEPFSAHELIDQPLPAVESLLRNKAGDIVIFGHGLPDRIRRMAELLKIEILDHEFIKTCTVITIFEKHQRSKIHAKYISWFPFERVVSLVKGGLTAAEKLTWLSAIGYPLFPSLHPRLGIDIFERSGVNITSSVEKCKFTSDGAGKYLEWVGNVALESTAPPICLILIGQKAGLKTFTTKRVVEALSASEGYGSSYGRVDSDAFGKWLTYTTLGNRLPSSWMEFDTFQNDECIISALEFEINLWCDQEGVTELHDCFSHKASNVVGSFAKRYVEIISDKVTGLSVFFQWLLELPGIPKALILEAHTNVEIAFYPPTTSIITLFAPYDVSQALLSRPNRPGISKIGELILQSYYRDLAPEHPYRGVYPCELLRLSGASVPVLV
ncbi:non-structural protein 7 [Taro reovirus 1]|nr:non-structural protein 7 [Taro reovirus 1]